MMTPETTPVPDAATLIPPATDTPQTLAQRLTADGFELLTAEDGCADFYAHRDLRKRLAELRPDVPTERLDRNLRSMVAKTVENEKEKDVVTAARWLLFGNGILNISAQIGGQTLEFGVVTLHVPAASRLPIFVLSLPDKE